MNAVAEKPVPDGTAQSQPLPPAAPPPAAPPPSRGRVIFNLLRPVVALAALVLAVIAGLWWMSEGRWVMSTDNAYVQGDIVTLTARVEGDITAIPVADNQRVKAGTPLVALDPADYTARRDQARAALAEAEAAVVTAQRQTEQARLSIDSASAAVAQAEAEAVRAAADAGRSGALTGAGWTSRQANDLAIATTRKADAALVAAKAQKSVAEQTMAVADAQIATAQARVGSARAALALAENNLSYTTIRAPFDGVVGNRAAQLGQHVMQGQQLLALAPPPERLYVIANFKETQLRRMQPGQKVRLIPDIDAAFAVTGRVDSIAPATGALFSLLPPENATGNFTKVVQRVPVKLILDPAEAAKARWLRAGLSVTAEVDTRGPDAERLGFFGAAFAAIGLH
jgi:membrane fusion protein (multidrug efflux system)